MEDKHKQLLLRYLCMALPYNVRCQIPNDTGVYTLLGIDEGVLHLDTPVYDEGDGYFDIEQGCKPYLRSMATMTDEEKRSFLYHIENVHYEIKGTEQICIPCIDLCETDTDDRGIINLYNIIPIDSIIWLLKNHFDFFGLIYMDLAVEAPEGIY